MIKKLTVRELTRLREKARKKMALSQSGKSSRIIVHMGTCGIASGAEKILHAILSEIKEMKLHHIQISTSGCAGLCSREPMMTVIQGGEPPVKYADLTPRRSLKILKEHVQGGKIVSEYVLAVGEERIA